MRLKNSLKDYDTVDITRVTNGKRNEDAITTINLMLQNNIVALHINGIGYSYVNSVAATFRTLKEAKNVATPIVIDGEVYLVRNEYYEVFKNHFGNARNVERPHKNERHCHVKKVKPVNTHVTRVTTEVKPTIAIKTTWKSNANILAELKALFNIAVEYSNMTLANYKSSEYYNCMKNIIASNLTSDHDKINFKDYLSVVDIDSNLNYILQDLI